MTRNPNPREGHIDDDHLVDQALGEAPSDDDRAHLEDCARCRESFASLVRTIGVARAASTLTLVPPRTDLWATIEASLDDPPSRGDNALIATPTAPTTAAAPTAPTTPAAPTTPTPPVQLPRHAQAGERTPRRRPALAWLVAACTAGALLGAGGVLGANRIAGGDEVPTRTVATAELDTLDTRTWLGSASVVEQGEGVSLEVTADVRDPANGYIEVWLINRDGKRMVSVGVLGWPGEPGSFSISRKLLDEGYVVVDISQEQFDDQPEHSGQSLVRGTLTTPS